MSQEIFIAYSGLRNRALSLEVLANNLSNLAVTGFKKDVLYSTVFNRVRQISNDPMEIAASDAASSEKTIVDFSPGNLVRTGNPLHVALAGDGFFVVDTPSGSKYTRNGAFSLNSEKEIVTSDGFPVLGENGRIRVDGPSLEIGAGGEVSVGGVQAGKLKIVQFEDLGRLKKAGGAFFEAPADSILLPPAKLDVRQAHLEQANVEPMQAVSEMISLLRSFEMLSQAIRSVSNEVNKKVIDEVART
jgi:flagellar basal-body rod protein FlgF